MTGRFSKTVTWHHNNGHTWL